MPRSSPVDRWALDALLTRGRSVATHRELRQTGLSASTITRRIGPDGPWQRLLPGVVAGHRGVPTRFERRLAGIKYAGAGAVLTGLDALALHGVRLGDLATDDRVHVLIPHAVQRTSHGFALLTRTRRAPEVITITGLPCTGVARAVVDAARRSELKASVRELVAAVVQQRRCTVEELAEEVRLAARQRSALSRVVLAEVSAGVRSVAEAELRDAFARFGVPRPRWNTPIRTPDGEVVMVPDALWPQWRALLEVDSVEWHLSPAAYRATQARQLRAQALGWRAVLVSPADVHRDPAGLCREVVGFLQSAAAAIGEDLGRSPAA